MFKFDYDLTWMCFLLDANDRIYSRYGGRDSGHSEARLSVAGLKYTMKQVLQDHQPPREFVTPKQPTLPRDLFAVKGKGCMHCHNVWEGLRRQARTDGTFTRESLYVYPLPENIGLKLDVSAGNKVLAVTPKSAGARAGIKPGDLLAEVHGTKIRSQCDVMHALHAAPLEGKFDVRWQRDGMPQQATLDVSRGWKVTDLSWRASMRREKR